MDDDAIDKMINDALISDDAHKYKATLSLDQRRALYTSNGLVEGKLELTPEERARVKRFMGVKRPGYIAMIRNMLS